MTDPAARTLEQASPVVNKDNPWPGLASFSEEQAEFFYGREREVEDLFRRVRFNALAVLYGQSGLGKTSLVQAALFPRLRGIRFVPVPIRIDYSPQAPASRLQIGQFVVEAVEAVGGTARRIGAQESLWEYFHREAPAATDASGRPLTVVLAFDQFEELFTHGYERGDARGFSQDFIEELGSLSEHRPPARVEAEFDRDPRRVADFDFDRQDYRLLISLREDFLAHLHDLSVRIPSITVNNMRLAPLDGIRALEVVERPGKGLVAPGAAEDIVRFVAGAGEEKRDGAPGQDRPVESLEVEPALLSLFCQRLNQKRGGGLITRALVAARSEKILTEFYESSLADLHPGARRFVEEDLLTAKGFRQTLSLDSAEAKLAEYGAPISDLTRLVQRRLLHFEQRGRLTRVELTHDVLTRVVRESRKERQAKEAEEARRREAEESERRAEAELTRVRKRQRVTRALLGVVALAAAAAVGFALKARNSTRKAEATAAALRQTQQGLEQSTLAAQQAGARAEQERAAAVRAESSAVTAKDIAHAALAKSEQMLADFCRYSLSVINRFGDSTAGKSDLTNAYNVLVELSDASVENMVRQNPNSACPHQLEARTETAATGIQAELGNNESAKRRGYKALQAARTLFQFPDSISRRVAVQSYFDLTYQLWRVDANDSAAYAAREGTRLGSLIDPRGDSSAFNRLGRVYHYGSLAVLDIAKTDSNPARRRELIDEARRMADSGLAVVDRGLKRKDQLALNLLYTKSQLWLRRGETDSAAHDSTRALAAYRTAVAVAAELHTVQRNMGSRRWRAITHASLGNLAFRLGKFEEARTAHDSAVVDWGVYLATYRELGNQAEMESAYDGIAFNLLESARAERYLGRALIAISLVRQAIDTADASYRLRASPVALRTRATTYNSAGEIVEGIPRRDLADSFYLARIRLDSAAFVREASNLAVARNYEQGVSALITVTQLRASADTARKPVAEAVRILRVAEERVRRLREQQLSIRRRSLALLQPIRPRTDSIRRVAVLRDSIAEALGNLSWSELMVERPEQALDHAKESLQLSDKNSFVLPNLLNAMVLTGDDEGAAAYFRANATRMVESSPVLFACAVIRDIRALRWRGVATDRHVQLVERLGASQIAQCRFPTLPTQ